MATVKQSGGDYSSLASACSSAEATISIEGTWTAADTTTATVTAASTTITADASSKHPGYYNTASNHYRLEPTSGHCITVSADNCSIEGICICQKSTKSSDEGIRVNGAYTLDVTSCLIFALANTIAAQDGIYIGNDAVTLTVTNCMIWSFNRCGVNYQNFAGGSGTGTLNVNSCTIWDCGHDNQSASEGPGGIGVDKGGLTISINIFNSILVGNANGTGAADINESTGVGGATTWTVDRTIVSDTSLTTFGDTVTDCLESRTETDSGSPGTGDWVIFNDITGAPTAIDLRLQDNAENDAQDLHADTTGAGLSIPSTDLLGTSRPQNTNYDAGAFEISAGAPPATRRVMVVS